MGNGCCRAESPCGSAEERSVLLKDDSKVAACAGGTVVVGTCGPGGDDDVRKTPEEEEEAKVVPVKPSPKNGVTELSNTQENGPLQTESVQTATPSPRKASELKENGTRAQDAKEAPAAAGGKRAELPQCTLNSVPEVKATAEPAIREASNEEGKEGNASRVEDRIPGDVSPTVETARTERPHQTEINTTPEHMAASLLADHDEDDGAKEEEPSEVTVDDVAAGLCEELTPNDEVTSVPNALLCQSNIAVEQETRPLSCAATEDLDNSGSSSACKEEEEEEEAHPGDAKSHDVCLSGSEPAEPASSEENEGSSSSPREPETTAPAEARESLKCDPDAEADPECAAASSSDVCREEVVPKVPEDKAENVPKAKEDDGTTEPERTEGPATEAESQAERNAEIQETTEHLEGEALEVQAEATPTSKMGDGLENSEEDLYRGAEELSTSHSSESGRSPSSDSKLSNAEDRCSLSPAMDILSYSEREWRGNTAKSALIKKGYKEMAQRFSLLRRVRGDNYCALRATLFQVLSHSTHLPAWLQEDDVTTLPQQLGTQEGLISQWTFPGECLQGDGTGDATQQLKSYMELLQNKWRAAVACVSTAERQQLCERVFQGGEEELGLLEALKLLMLAQAVELHGRMQAGQDVPLFCWLLFARDSSDCPRTFLSNHLSHVGLSAGLEQVEMFLLGYALQCTIQVYRLYKADTEEFVTFYPDDHKDDWPSVCLVTEDDRHYNVPIADAAGRQEEPASS